MEIDRNGLEVMEREECLRLLSTARLGRIAVSSGSLPTVFPVNFLLDSDRIVVRTSRGTKLDAATNNAVVAFEVDDIDAEYHAGWSVVVTGRARELTDPDDIRSLQSAPLARWAPRGEDHFMEISTELVSGRRLVPDLVFAEGEPQ